MQAAHIDIGLT